MNKKISLSFYLKTSGFFICRGALRTLNTPPFVKFYINNDATSMIMMPDTKLSFTSFRIPKNIYLKTNRMIIHSKSFCYLIAKQLNWNTSLSYQIPGKYLKKEKLILGSDLYDY